MAFGLYPEFENDDILLDWDTEGVLIVRAMDVLDRIAAENSITPLFGFNGQYAQIPEDYDGDPSEYMLPTEEWTWFEPAKGLITVDILISKIKDNPEILPPTFDREGLVLELNQLRLQLLEADRKHIRFQLCLG